MDEERHGPDEPTVVIHEREVVYEGFFRMERFRLSHRCFDGSMSPPLMRELFERGHAVMVLPYDPQRDEVVLLEQFRIGALGAADGPWLIEAVAGMIEPGESAEEVARREALEEAGVELKALAFICDYLVSPGGTSERISLYCGQVDSSKASGLHGLADEGEDIRVTAVPFDTAWRWLGAGRIDSASPIIALQWLKLQRESLRAAWLG